MNVVELYPGTRAEVGAVPLRHRVPVIERVVAPCGIGTAGRPRTDVHLRGFIPVRVEGGWTIEIEPEVDRARRRVLVRMDAVAPLGRREVPTLIQTFAHKISIDELVEERGRYWIEVISPTGELLGRADWRGSGISAAREPSLATDRRPSRRSRA